MEWWQIYLITRFDSLRDFICGTVTICGIASILMLICSFATRVTYSNDSLDWHVKEINKIKGLEKVLFRFVMPLGFLLAFLFVFIPSRDDVATIIAGHWATHNEEMKKLPDNVLKTLNGLLEKAQEKIK